jgi:hypothetical protein
VSRLGHGGAYVVPALVAVVARVLTGPHPIDDAYISFRYARNLAQGFGLVYNPGEWVLGTTAPLWAIVLAGGYRLGFIDLPLLATVISALCDAASVVFLVQVGMRLGWRPIGAACVGLAWALNPISVAFATGAMETSLFWAWPLEARACWWRLAWLVWPLASVPKALCWWRLWLAGAGSSTDDVRGALRSLVLRR